MRGHHDHRLLAADRAREERMIGRPATEIIAELIEKPDRLSARRVEGCHPFLQSRVAAFRLRLRRRRDRPGTIGSARGNAFVDPLKRPAQRLAAPLQRSKQILLLCVKHSIFLHDADVDTPPSGDARSHDYT